MVNVRRARVPQTRPGKSSCGGQMGQWRARLEPGDPNPRFLALGPEGTGRRDQAISSMWCSGLSRSRIVFSTCG